MRVNEDFLYITSLDALRPALEALAVSAEIGIDTETAIPRDEERRKFFTNTYNLTKTGESAPFDPHTSEVRLVQMKGEHTKPIVIDLWRLCSEGLGTLRVFFETYSGVFILANAKFDMKMIASSLGVWIDAQARIFDVIQASILMSNGVGMGRERGHSLASLSRDFLGVDLDKTEQASDWSNPDLSEEQLEYAALDVCKLHELKATLEDALVNQMKMPEPLELDMQCLGPTARMEYNGVPINLEVYDRIQEAAQYAMPGLLTQIGQYFKEQINQPLALTYLDIKDYSTGRVEPKPFMLPWGGGKVGKDFLMSRANLVKDMLLELGLRGEDGDPLESTEKAALEAFRESHPGVGLLIDYWNLVKQAQFDYRTYTHPKTGRIHARFSAGAASTGRFGCSNPNMQQIPAKFTMLHPDGSKLNYRYCFQAPEGWLMCSADFSGQELSVMAAMSGDPVMIEALNTGQDLHGIAGAGAFNVPLDKVRELLPGKDKSARDYGKIINFSLAYGKTAEGFAADWKVSKDEAKKVVSNYEKKFPVLTSWLKRHGELGTTQNYSRLPNGAMRFVGEAKRADKDAPKRASSNYQIQGLSSWMTRLAMIELDRRILRDQLPIQLIAVVHDECLAIFRTGDNCPTGAWMRTGTGDEKVAREICKAGCPEVDCAHKYETLIGECMEYAGKQILKDVVPAAFSVATCGHWKH